MEIMLKPWANPLNDADVNLAIADGEITRLCNVETKLRADLAEEKTDNEILRHNLEAEERNHAEELAARDLVIKQLKCFIYNLPIPEGVSVSEFDQALALKPTTEALDEFVQRAVLEEREACAEYVDRNLMSCREYAEAIRGRWK